MSKNHKELEFSEFIVAPASTQTTINRITFEHALKAQSSSSNTTKNTHTDNNIKTSNQNSKLNMQNKK